MLHATSVRGERLTRLMKLAGLALLLAGCTTAHLTQPVQFAVFFHAYSSDLTPSGQTVIAIASKTIDKDNPSKILIEGHADGGDAANLMLADQRATTVANALIAAGVSSSIIEKQAPTANDSPDDAVMAHKVIVTLEP
jgi:outer membrane protein OmpA-like peptidoglycan-associated protein